MEPSRSTPSSDRKRKRSAPEDTRSTPSEEEVEEFFTLLRRIHNAAKPSGKGNRAVRSRRFEIESRLVNGVKSGEKMDRVEEGADNGVMVFDLNSVPDEAQEP